MVDLGRRVKLTQEKHDHLRRAFIRRTRGLKLRKFGEETISKYGRAETARVRAGIEVLLANTYPEPRLNSACPALFYMPDLPPIRYWEMNQLSALRPFIEALEHLAAELSTKAESASDLLSGPWGNYMKTKFAPSTERAWKVINYFTDAAWCEGAELVKSRLEPHMAWVSNEIMRSRLDPHHTIPEHVDDNNYKLTLHLGLAIPRGDCRIRVGGEVRSWQRGKVLAFSDSFVHEIWNKTANPRDILLLDVWRPDLSPIEIHILKRIRRILSPASEPAALLEIPAPGRVN